jgi:hypothetical protein
MATPDPTEARLDSQIKWYDERSASNKRWYEGLKATEIVAAAAVPVSVAVYSTAWLAATLGALVVVLEGILQLKQFHSTWLTYRSTCEALKHEKYLYLAKAGPYASVPDPHALLATRIEETVSRENAKWVGTQSQEPSKGQQLTGQ